MSEKKMKLIKIKQMKLIPTNKCESCPNRLIPYEYKTTGDMCRRCDKQNLNTYTFKGDGACKDCYADILIPITKCVLCLTKETHELKEEVGELKELVEELKEKIEERETEGASLRTDPHSGPETYGNSKELFKKYEELIIKEEEQIKQSIYKKISAFGQRKLVQLDRYRNEDYSRNLPKSIILEMIKKEGFSEEDLTYLRCCRRYGYSQ